MKKLLSLFMVPIVLASTMSLTALASDRGSSSAVADPAAVEAGASTSIEVSLVDNPGIDALVIVPGAFDDLPNGFSVEEMKGVGMTDAAGVWKYGSNAVWLGSDSTYTGEVLEVTVSVDEEVAPSTSPYTIKFLVEGSMKGEIVEFGTCTAEITVLKPECKEHTGGEATCTEQAICENCGKSYGEALGHTGGTATCQAEATCTRCGEKYGELDKDNHTGEQKLYDVSETYTGDLRWSCCDALISKGHTIGGGNDDEDDDRDDNDYTYDDDDDEDEEYRISIGTFKGGKVICNDDYASEGDTVRLQAIPNSGFELKELKVLDSNGKELRLTNKGNGVYTFKMPDGKVTIKATFVELMEEEENRNTGAI